MPIDIGGEGAWKVYRKGDIGVAFHWITVPSRELDDEPCMVLFPMRRRLGSAAYILPMKRAHEFADSNGHASPTLVESAMKAAEVMAMDQTKGTVFRIADVILDCIEDLLRMPPAPPKKMLNDGHMGVMSLQVDGETVIEQEVPVTPDMRGTGLQ